jgi:DeoR family transcriptional regulator of aga operon
MNREERLARLVELVIERGSVRLEELVAELGISPATARRDLDDLADQQLIVRTRGGALANPSSGEMPLRFRSGRQSAAKQAIASYAASLVNPGDVIGFNAGTTTTAAAHEVGVRIAGDRSFAPESLTIVTNAVNIANSLTVRPQARVVVTGGVARTRSFALVGRLAQAILPTIQLDTVFLGANAVDLTAGGIYTDSEEEAAMDAAMLAASRRVVVLADASKLTEHAFARICGLDAVSLLVTDHSADEALVAELRGNGVEVVLAGE